MYQDKYVFAQLASFLNRSKFNRIVAKYKGDKYVKHFTCWNQLLSLMFGQLSNRESRRDLIVALDAHHSKSYHLGLGKNVSKSSRARANQDRDYHIFEEYAYYLVNEARQKRVSEIFKLEDNVYAFDSTTIDLCLSVFWWAKFRKKKGGIKVHTLYDVETQIPAFFHITEASVHDSTAMKEIPYESGSYYIFDRAYNHFKMLYKIHQIGAFFVVRAKKNLQYKIIKWKRRLPKNVLSDVTIILDSPLTIRHPYITIAGQTAPGDGICIRRHPLNIGADNVIIRYLRVRLGNESGNDYDAMSSRYCKHIILDHISASWCVDECMSIYHCDSITVQWCIISESMSHSNHVKGSHGFGGIWGSNYGTYHHNLLAHHSSRNPRMASGSGNTDYQNNVIYNWGYQSLYGGEKYQKGNDKFNFSNFNVVANYYKPGPATKPGEVMYRIANPSSRSEFDYGQWHIAGNTVEDNKEVTEDNWNGGVQTELSFDKIRMVKPWPAMPINQHTAEEAYQMVLDNAGARLPKRDIVDERIIKEVLLPTKVKVIKKNIRLLIPQKYAA